MHVNWVQWFCLGLWLVFSVTVAAAASSEVGTGSLGLSSKNISPSSPVSAPPAPWERTALIGTGGVLGIASMAEQVNPAVMAAAVGGALGSVTRMVVSQSVGGFLEQDFPYGTVAVNIVGCFAFGLVSGMVGLRRDTPDSVWFTLVTTGFLGGFTTFSSFTYDAIHLQREEGIFSATTYTGLSLGVSIMALLVGEYIGNFFAYP